MDYIIREIKKEEYDLLNDFLYNAIYIPDGVEPPPKSIINCPELQEYVFEFGKRKDDRALVAEVQGNVVGAIWVRIMNDYGHIDNDTPSLAMSVFQKYRGQGIGTSLLQQLLLVEKTSGYSKLSLSVQKNNYAVKMYKKAGFLVVDENSEEYMQMRAGPVAGACPCLRAGRAPCSRCLWWICRFAKLQELPRKILFPLVHIPSRAGYAALCRCHSWRSAGPAG